METPAQIWATNMQYRATREKYWKPKIYANLLQMIRDATNYPSNELALQMIGISISGLQISQTLTDLYTDAGRVMGGRAYQQVRRQVATQKALLPLGYNEDIIEEIIAYFREHLLEKAVLPITDTMRAWIIKSIIEGQKESKSISMIAEELIKADFPKVRAFVITRTEVLRAANFGSIQGAKKAGFKMQKYWISGQDFRTRTTPLDAFNHRSVNGLTVEMDEPFKIPKRDGGYEDLQFPGDPNGSAADVIQCRCTQGYRVYKDSNGIPIKT